jgi:hypothetical protein
MKLSDLSAWRLFGFALTAITVVLAVRFVIGSSELAQEGWAFLDWQVDCVKPLACGVVAYFARQIWLAGRVSRHYIEPEGDILLAPLAVVVIGSLLAYSRCAYDARFALSRGALERAVHSGETFKSHDKERWIGLYKIRSIQIDALGRTAFDVGDCSMFAHCELEFDATTPCELRGSREYRAVDTYWCVVVHDHL